MSKRPANGGNPIDIPYILSRSEKVDSGCIEYRGSIGTHGYGWLPRNTVFGSRYAHREVMQQTLGRPLDNRLECVLHTCDNRKCVNIEHLFLGNYSDNALDRERKGRGFDMRGENHPLYGKQHSPESRAKMTRSAIARDAAGLRSKDEKGRYV